MDTLAMKPILNTSSIVKKKVNYQSACHQCQLADPMPSAQIRNRKHIRFKQCKTLRILLKYKSTSLIQKRNQGRGELTMGIFL
jgi:hypothetical protein